MYLIKNDDQRAKTLQQVRKFEERAAEIREREGAEAARGFLRAYGPHIRELKQQVREYDKLRRENLPGRVFSQPGELGGYLVKARIAAGVTQAELAGTLHVSQPMVHKYEISEYAGCGLELLTGVANALGVRIAVRARRKGSRRKAASVTGPGRKKSRRSSGW